MKVTEALKQELTQWLETYWATYLKGDLETWATMLRDDYRNIGGTRDEIWHSKQEIIDYTNQIMDQLNGSVDFRNREVDLIPYGAYIMVHEFTDIYVQTEGEWILYSPFRMSSLLEKTDTGWVTFHQHGSYPDMRAMEGEAFSMDAMKAENARLKEAVKSRTYELEIEAALERVRAVAMGMKKPEDMLDVCREISAQLQKFGVKHIRNVQTAIINENIGQYLCYQYFPTYDQIAIEDTEYHKNPVEYEMVKQMLACCDGYFIGSLKGEVLDEFRLHRKEENYFFDPLLDESTELGYCFLSIGEGGLGLTLYRPLEDAVLTLFRRFHRVFSLAYQRFRDIQKAEEQAREAQIEAALEKVRSRSLAMHRSDELNEVVTVLFERLKDLQIPFTAVGIAISIDGSKDLNAFVCGENEDGLVITNYRLLYFDHIIASDFNNAIEKQLDFFVGYYSKEEKDSFYEYLFEHTPELNHLPEDIKRMVFDSPTYTVTMIAVNKATFNINDFQGKILSENEVDIIKRFAKVFDQAYTRFLDLQKAEAQTRRSNIEVALERVRARALAMQEPEELKSVAEVLRQEMGALGVEELETSSIYIHDEGSSLSECWYAIKDIRSGEKSLVSDHFPLNLDDTWVGRQMKTFFESDATMTSIMMQGTNRMEWIRYCEKMSQPLQGYYGEEIPDRTYHLYKFTHGAIGAASAGDISPESWELLQRAASVFSLAYSRFKDLTQARIDLQRLKEEKQRAEDALSELQLTQRQLIQAEKMASLGELTAGIAHEIQNPLNFVNNFSEVSNELIGELVEEVDKGNTEEVKLIAKDVQQNLEKINHHGKRADAIVKGMLQHSRTSTGQKEPTDINTLCDEYLRLAFHGLKARDNSFEASFRFEPDNTLPNINVVPQDIGRVLLNLINNAFQAVSEKQKTAGTDYVPEVIVSTKLISPQAGLPAGTAGGSRRAEISVKDNGPGIPEAIREKIFQPFFTTKPTGQATGLGLSLSYDIVKAHGGEILFESRKDIGTSFIIRI